MKQRPDNMIEAAGILLMIQHPTQQFLLMRHSSRWDLPKGHCEAGESLLETALRETHEETGIAANQIEIDSTFRFQLEYPVTYKRSGDQLFLKRVDYFLGYIDAKPTLRITEHESATWFDWGPPHQIQTQTIDPLLDAITRHLRGS